MSPTRLSRPERAALTRRALLDAAEERFLSEGYHATSLEAVALDAGYTKGAIFAAFESKAGLFLALCDEVFARRLAQVEALFEHFSTMEERLAALASRPIDERDERWLRVAIEFCSQAASNPAQLGEFRRHYERMHEGLARLAGEEPCALEPRQMAIVMLALTNGLSIERMLDPEGVPSDLMARTLELLYGAAR